MIFNNQQLSSSNIYVTGDLAFLVILLGKEHSSPHWYIKCQSTSKYWKLSNHKIGDEWSIENIKICFNLEKNTESLGVKEEPYWDFVEVDNYICPILHNQINLGNNVFHNLLDYGNEHIEMLSVDEDKARNSILMSDSSIKKTINLRDEFDVSNEGKELSSLKNNRRNDKTPIIKKKKKKKNFKLYFNSLLYVAHILGLQELNEIYSMLTVERTYEVRKIFLKI